MSIRKWSDFWEANPIFLTARERNPRTPKPWFLLHTIIIVKLSIRKSSDFWEANPSFLTARERNPIQKTDPQNIDFSSSLIFPGFIIILKLSIDFWEAKPSFFTARERNPIQKQTPEKLDFFQITSLFSMKRTSESVPILKEWIPRERNWTLSDSHFLENVDVIWKKSRF